MDINYFQEFAILAEIGNYMTAADKLYMTQSALTRHIQAFEKELGTPVFDRTTRKIVLNEYGKIMLPYARKIMQIQQEYKTAVYNQQRLDRDNLQIGAIPMMDSYGIMDLLIAFKEKNPSVSVDIIESDTSELLDMLKNGKCDFAFIRDFNHSCKDISCINYSEDSMIAIVPDSHPLSKEKTVSITQLQGTPLLLLAKDTFMYKLCITECNNAGFNPTVPFTSRYAGNLIDLAQKGQGIAMLTEKPILKYDLSGVSIVDIRPAIDVSIDLVYLSKTKLSNATVHFLNYVKEVARKPKTE